MDSVLLITISAFILAVILIIVTIVIIKRNQNKKYKKEIEELDIRKNNLIGVPVLSEITKVKELIKTDNLKNKLDDWDNTFTTIRDEKIPELTDLISEADFLIDRKDYKQAVKKITNIEIEINSLKKKTDHLLEEVKLITNSEERNRALITKLKIVYREDQNKFERSKKEYGVIADYLEKEIDNIDDLFAKFEKAMDNNDYVSVEKKINLLDDKITKLGKLLEDIPTIVLMATVLVPNKIDEAITYYYRMKRDGYPLDYLNVEYNIKEIKNKIDNIMENLKKLELGESIIELKTFVEILKASVSALCGAPAHSTRYVDKFYRDKVLNSVMGIGEKMGISYDNGYSGNKSGVDFGFGNNLAVNFQPDNNSPFAFCCFNHIFCHFYFLSNFASASSFAAALNSVPSSNGLPISCMP